MKVIKDYGAVAEHGSKTLRLQTISVFNEKKLALVSYKDGMSVNSNDITAEAKELKRLLEEYLDYKEEPKATVIEIPKKDIIHTLTTMPANDCNYQTALRDATEDELNEAIETMKQDGGRHATRIKYCESALVKKNTRLPFSDNEPEEETPKKETKKKAEIIQFPTEDKRPQIIKLETSGNRTYEECVEKMNKEKAIFKDSDSQYVIEGLLELCKVDQGFRNNLMREDKTYGDFMSYMFKAAQNGYCIKYGNVGWLDRDQGLGLAIDYYNADSKKMEAEEKKQREKEAAEKKKEAKKNGKTNTKNKKTTA